MAEKKPTGFALHPELINRKGRPKRGEAFAEILRKHLEKRVPDKHGKTASGRAKKIRQRDALAREMIRLALEGEDERTRLQAIENAFNRAYGRPHLPLDHGFPDAPPELVLRFEPKGTPPQQPPGGGSK